MYNHNILNVVTQNNLGVIEWLNGNTNLALSYFNNAISLCPDIISLHNHIAIVLREKGKTKEAERHIKIYSKKLYSSASKDPVMVHYAGKRVIFGKIIILLPFYNKIIERFSVLKRISNN